MSVLFLTLERKLEMIGDDVVGGIAAFSSCSLGIY